MCGSSFINERYEGILRDRLKHALYLENRGNTLPTIISQLLVGFENQDKKKLDTKFLDPQADCTIKVPGLKRNKKLRFEDNRLVLNR